MQHEFLGLLLSAKTLLRHHHASSSLQSCLKNSPPYSVFSRLNVFPMLLKTSSIPCHSHMHAKLLQSDFLWPYQLQPIRLLWPWDSSGMNTGVGCHAPLQRIFLTQGWNLSLFCLLHWWAGSLSLIPPGKPIYPHRNTFLNVVSNWHSGKGGDG